MFLVGILMACVCVWIGNASESNCFQSQSSHQLTYPSWLIANALLWFLAPFVAIPLSRPDEATTMATATATASRNFIEPLGQEDNLEVASPPDGLLSVSIGLPVTSSPTPTPTPTAAATPNLTPMQKERLPVQPPAPVSLKCKYGVGIPFVVVFYAWWVIGTYLLFTQVLDCQEDGRSIIFWKFGLALCCIQLVLPLVLFGAPIRAICRLYQCK